MRMPAHVVVISTTVVGDVGWRGRRSSVLEDVAPHIAAISVSYIEDPAELRNRRYRVPPLRCARYPISVIGSVGSGASNFLRNRQRRASQAPHISSLAFDLSSSSALSRTAS